MSRGKDGFEVSIVHGALGREDFIFLVENDWELLHGPWEAAGRMDQDRVAWRFRREDRDAEKVQELRYHFAYASQQAVG